MTSAQDDPVRRGGRELLWKIVGKTADVKRVLYKEVSVF